MQVSHAVLLMHVAQLESQLWQFPESTSRYSPARQTLGGGGGPSIGAQVTAKDPSELTAGDDRCSGAQVSQVKAKEQVAQLESQLWQFPEPSRYCPAEHVGGGGGGV